MKNLTKNFIRKFFKESELLAITSKLTAEESKLTLLYKKRGMNFTAEQKAILFAEGVLGNVKIYREKAPHPVLKDECHFMVMSKNKNNKYVYMPISKIDCEEANFLIENGKYEEIFKDDVKIGTFYKKILGSFVKFKVAI